VRWGCGAVLAVARSARAVDGEGGGGNDRRDGSSRDEGRATGIHVSGTGSGAAVRRAGGAGFIANVLVLDFVPFVLFSALTCASEGPSPFPFRRLHRPPVTFVFA